MLRLSTTHKTVSLWACSVGNSCISDTDSVAEPCSVGHTWRGFNLLVRYFMKYAFWHTSAWCSNVLCGQCPTRGVFWS